MMNKYIVTGDLIRVDEKYYYTTNGIFNKLWYRLIGG